jgi:hypothetical protein
MVVSERWLAPLARQQQLGRKPDMTDPQIIERLNNMATDDMQSLAIICMAIALLLQMFRTR